MIEMISKKKKKSQKEEEEDYERERISHRQVNSILSVVFIIIEVDENQNFHVISFFFFSTRSLCHNVCFTFILGII